MALERAIYVVILCFFALGSATICSYNSECDQFSGESCCSDSVCRKNCFYCSFDSDCGTGEECCDGDCSTFCDSSNSDSSTGASIAGAIVGTIVFFAIIISIVACFCCACCPYYRYRSPGTVIMSQPATHQTLVSTTQMSTMSSQPVQHCPPSGHPPANYSQPPPPNYSQPPPPIYSQPPPPIYSQPPPPNYKPASTGNLQPASNDNIQPVSASKLQSASTARV